MDAKKKAEASLSKERTKSKKLAEEIKSLKKQLPKSNKKKKKSGAAQTEEQDDSGEIARLQGELDTADEAVKRYTEMSRSWSNACRCWIGQWQSKLAI